MPAIHDIDFFRNAPLEIPENPSKRRVFPEDVIADALRESGGIYTQAAKWIADTYKYSFSRESIARRVKQSLVLRQAAIEGRARIVDKAESVLFKHAIEKEDPASVRYLLNCLGKDRGYGNQSQAASPTGSITFKWDDSGQASFVFDPSESPSENPES